MYGQMTAGSWIYIGSQGIVQGTYETFVELGAPALRRRPGGPLDPDRRPRRHGRRAAARRDHGRRLDARDRVPGRPASRCACATRYLDSRRADARRGAARSSAQRRATASRCPSACSATPRRSCRRWCERGVASRALVTDQTSAHDPAQRLPAERLDVDGVAGEARERPGRGRRGRARQSMAVHVRAMLDLQKRGRPDLRLRQQHPAGGEGRGRRRTPSISRASCRPTSGRCSAAASARSAGPRCPATRRTSTGPTRR